MKLLADKKITLKLKYKECEIIDRLECFVSEQKAYQCKVDKNHFSLRKRGYFDEAWHPVAKGKISVQSDVTHVDFAIGLDFVQKAVVVIFSILLGLGGFGYFLLRIVSKDFQWEAAYPAGLFALIFIFWNFQFDKEIKEIESVIGSLFGYQD